MRRAAAPAELPEEAEGWAREFACRVPFSVQLLLRARRVSQASDASVGPLSRRRVYLGASSSWSPRCGKVPHRDESGSCPTLFDADRRTIDRWRTFWREHFPLTTFWKVRGSSGARRPGGCSSSVAGGGLSVRDQRPRWLEEATAVSVTDHDPRGPKDRGFKMTDPSPAEDA